MLTTYPSFPSVATYAGTNGPDHFYLYEPFVSHVNAYLYDGDDILEGYVDGRLSAKLGDGNDISHVVSFNTQTIDGGHGDDVIVGSYGNDMLAGGDGNDMLAGGYGNDVLDGGYGNDVLDGGHGEDKIFDFTGLFQQNYFIVGAGDAVVRGGGNFDTIAIDPNDGTVGVIEVYSLPVNGGLWDGLNIQPTLDFTHLAVSRGDVWHTPLGLWLNNDDTDVHLFLAGVHTSSILTNDLLGFG